MEQHPGTPWAILAKREKLTALGLEWRPRAAAKLDHALIISRTVMPPGIIGSTCSWYGTRTSST